jgi:ABC-type Mn2+/Zn2+ transport system permease subunit
MDLTGWSIALGLVGAGPFALVKAFRHQRLDVAGAVTLFLGMFSVPLALASIRAAIIGDPNSLPTNWRELLAVAGVVTLLLTLWFAKKAYVSAFRPSAEATAPAPGADPER